VPRERIDRGRRRIGTQGEPQQRLGGLTWRGPPVFVSPPATVPANGARMAIMGRPLAVGTMTRFVPPALVFRLAGKMEA
jgi:hypothetical protein